MKYLYLIGGVLISGLIFWKIKVIINLVLQILGKILGMDNFSN